VCENISLGVYLPTNYRKEKTRPDGRGLSWSFITRPELVGLAFAPDFRTGFCNGLGQISFLSGLQDLSCQTFTSLKTSLLNYIFSRLRNLKHAWHSALQPVVAKSRIVLCLGKPETPLNNPAAAECDALPAANCCGLPSAAMNGF